MMNNVLIIGTGGIGRRHIPGLLKTTRACVSVVEPNASKRKAVCREYDIVADYADIKDVDLHKFDAAVVCAPAHLHVPLAQACVDADLHVLVEKPLAATMDGVDRLIGSAKARGVVARVAYVRRASPETIRLREQILDGRIGPVRLCYINCSQHYPKYRPDYQRIYYAKEATGGGTILDGASHMIDLVLWILGAVTEVASMYDRLQLEGVECEDSALISLRLASGAMVQISMNQFQQPNVCTIEMIGPKGNLVLDAVTSRLRFADDDSGHWEVEEFAKGTTPGEFHEARFVGQANLFLDAVDGKPCHLTTLAEARDNLHIALAAKESYRTKRIVKL